MKMIWLDHRGECVVAAISPANPQNKHSIVVDGNDWMRPLESEGRALIIGAGNMIAAEAAYTKRTGRYVLTCTTGTV